MSKNVIHVQHVIKIFQALLLLQFFAFKFARGGGELGSRLATLCVCSLCSLYQLAGPERVIGILVATPTNNRDKLAAEGGGAHLNCSPLQTAQSHASTVCYKNMRQGCRARWCHWWWGGEPEGRRLASPSPPPPPRPPIHTQIFRLCSYSQYMRC